MEDNFINILLVIFCVVAILFVIHLIKEYSKKVDRRTVTFNNEIDIISVPGRELISDSIHKTEPHAVEKSKKVEKDLEPKLKDSSVCNCNSKNKKDCTKDLSGFSDSYSNSLSSFETVPTIENPDFFDATGLPVENTNVHDSADFKPDMELTYNQWFQGKTPVEFHPPKGLKDPNTQKNLSHEQNYVSLGEWTYKDEYDMNTGKTGNNVTGYSSFHDSVGLYNNKLEVSACNK